MATSQFARVALCAAAILGAGSLAASAQQSPQEQAPAAPRAAPEPAPQAPQPPKEPAVKPSEAPGAQGPQALIGLNVYSSDGTRVGEVRSVATGPNGDIVALHIRTGGFLGFGGRIVAVPGGKFIKSGQSIRLDLDSDQVSDLPQVKD